MDKVLIFYGAQQEFEKLIPKNNARNLTDVVMETDSDTRVFTVQIPNKPEIEKEKLQIENFIIESSEYAGVREHVILNFANFVAKLDIKNMYLHNPPLQISNQLKRLFSQSEIVKQEYTVFSNNHIIPFSNSFDERLKGQESAKIQILKSLFPLTTGKHEKPIVLLFYGDTGLGKTEAAKVLADVLGEKLFRKQFSMFQNNQFSTYLFGGAHYEKSFAKDLLDRESNVILLDEFDKANPVFHSAFYQLFDDSIYEDQNYYLELKKSVIICTSNYKSVDEIKKQLGNAIFSRFDSVIKFDSLNNKAKTEIAEIQYQNKLSIYDDNQQQQIESKNIKTALINSCVNCTNAREIEHLIEQTFSLVLIQQELNKNSSCEI